MADQLKKSNRNRTQKSEQKPKVKHQKRKKCEASINDEAAASAEVSITNIYNELVDRILDFLD